MEISTIVAYSLGASAALLTLLGGHLAIWRYFWTGSSAKIVHELQMKVTELEFSVVSIADQFEQSVRTNSSKLGKLRRQLARERGEDIEDVEEASDQVPGPGPAGVEQVIDPNDKRELWARARERGVA